MTSSEKTEFKKAYVELYEIIKKMSKQEIQKIPEEYIVNLKNEMDKTYKFEFDDKNNILNQNFKVETKALLVELYERFLAPDDEKEFWKKYDRICIDAIEKEKKKRFPTKVIRNKSTVEISNIENISNLPVKTKEKNILERFIQFLKRIFSIK